jgi:microsomal dipeptidase-like Zn-dependent dipeptidase
MTAIQVTIRDAVYDKIVASKATFVITRFDVEKTYFPSEDLENLSEQPKVKVIAVGFGSNRERVYRDGKTIQLDLPVQVAIQQKVDPKNNPPIDKLVELIEQIMNICEDDELVSGQDYTWLRTEPLKDENDLIYSYEALTVNGVFQAVFTVHYSYIKET